MTEGDLKKAWAEMQHCYRAWEQAVRPKSNFNTNYLQYDMDPVLLDRLGSFRDNQWRDYVKARDTYLEMCKQGVMH